MADQETARLLIEFQTKGDKKAIAAFTAMAKARKAEADAARAAMQVQRRNNQEREKDVTRTISTEKSVRQVRQEAAVAAANAARQQKQLGYAVQNASYQFTDYIVQVQGGVSATRAFSQQAPQLLGSLGPIGAGIGVIAALAPALVVAFTDGADSAKDLAGELDDANDSVEDFVGYLDRLKESGDGVAATLASMSKAASNTNFEQFLEALKAESNTGMLDLLKSYGLGAIEGAGLLAGSLDKLFLGIPGAVLKAVGDAQAPTIAFLNGVDSSIEKLQLKYKISGTNAGVLQTILTGKGGTGVAGWDLEKQTKELARFMEQLGNSGEIEQAQRLLPLLKQMDEQLQNFYKTVFTGAGGPPILPSDFEQNMAWLEKSGEIFEENTKAVQKNREEYAKYVTKLRESAQALNESADPQLAFNARMNELDELLKFGSLSMAAYTAEVKKATDARNASLDALDLEGIKIREEIAAYEKQYEAQSRIADSYRMAVDPLEKYSAELLKIASVRDQLDPETEAKAIRAANEEYEKAKGGIDLGIEAIKSFDSAFGSFVSGVASGTADIQDLFKNMAKAMIADMLKIIAYQAVIQAFGGASGGGFGQTFASAVGFGPKAKGAAFDSNGLEFFAKGGVVNGATMFNTGAGIGVAGEAGPEAIMPLSRDSSGKLGVGAPPINLVVNNNAPGVDVQTSQGADGGLTIDVVTRAVAGAIRSGGNDIADAIGNSYGLSRGQGAA